MSVDGGNSTDTEDKKQLALAQGQQFRLYLWGENGICPVLKKLEHKAYGKDLGLILLQFYVNPMPFSLQHIKEIERYRPKEKSIGLPIIVNQENFFSQTEEARRIFLRNAILQKLALLAQVITKKKLDTNIDLLIADVQKLLPQ